MNLRHSNSDFLPCMPSCWRNDRVGKAALAAPFVLLGVASAVQAQPAPEPDLLTLRAGYEQQYDSNLFRLPEGANLQARLGRDSADEQIGITTVGATLDKRYSLQRVQLDVSLVDYRYRHFSQLDFVARNYNAAWRWALTPRLRGNLTTQRQQSLSSFADVQGFNRQNQSTRSQQRFDAQYELDGAWRLLAGLSRTSQTNLAQLEEEDNTRTRSGDVGLRYDYASGSTMGYRIRSAHGEYLRRDVFSALDPQPGVGSSFEQLSHEFQLRWVWSPKTTADFSATYLRREHLTQPGRDFSGINAMASVAWKATGKTTLVASWHRDLASYQTASTNYVQTDRISLAPVWQATAKTAVRLRHTVSQRRFLGHPEGLPGSTRRNLTHETALAVTWAAHRNATLSASLARSTRSSTTPGLDFSSNRALISAQIRF